MFFISRDFFLLKNDQTSTVVTEERKLTTYGSDKINKKSETARIKSFYVIIKLKLLCLAYVTNTLKTLIST